MEEVDGLKAAPEDVKVLIHAPDLLSQLGLAGALRATPGIEILSPDDREQAQVLVVVTDRLRAGTLSMLRQNAVEVGTPVVLISDELHEDDLLTAVECKIVGILARTAVNPERLRRVVLTAATGGAMLPPAMLGGLITHVERLLREFSEHRGGNRSGLAEREIEVLRLMADGHDTAAVAAQLCYSERTIKNVLSAVMTRLNLRNRSHAIAYAMRAGLI